MAVSTHRSRTSAGGRLPRGPHRLSAEEVAEDQRGRLIDAMLKFAAERGYAATTVADIIVEAEVSRKTFYAHFADRRELLLAAFDTTSAQALEEVRSAAQRTGGPTRQFEALMRRLSRIARESPGTIALSTIEIAAVKPDGLQRRERLMEAYGVLIDECLRAETAQPALPPTIARALAGSTYRTIDAQLRTGRASGLQDVSSQLARWTRSQHPVPAAFFEEQQSQAPGPSIEAVGLLGGRAPGTLTLSPSGYELPRATRSTSFTHHANRERILDAVAQLTAVNGYPALTAQAIAEHADISERAFLAHFKNKDEAFAAAVEIGHVKGQALIERARSSTSDWRIGVQHAIHALLEFLASEPYFTQLAFVDAPLAGPAMAKRTHEHAGAYARLLLDGAPQRRRPPAIAPEATVHGIFELAFHYAAEDEVAHLPRVAREASYLTLAPFLGVSEAAEVAASLVS
jgi:AcrR family transcriptional regulator